jgi:lon-related putative ATP-dependent protease
MAKSNTKMNLELSHKELKREVTLTPENWKVIEEESLDKPLIGQDRALAALEFGIGNKLKGFNIYVSGYPGSGKLKAINHFLEEKARTEPPPGDWCYVYNFRDPYCPKKIGLPRGGARTFRLEIQNFIQEAQKALVEAFESKEYAGRRQEIIDDFKEQEESLFEVLHRQAKENNFTIRRTPIDYVIIRLDDEGKPLNDKKFRRLDKSMQNEILSIQDELKELLMSLLREKRDLERENTSKLVDLEKKVALFCIEGLLEELLSKYEGLDDVQTYLEDIKTDIIQELKGFLEDVPENFLPHPSKGTGITKYEVNIVVDNTDLQGAPIIAELNPTYNNLFGKVEHESHMGTLVTNFTFIRSGALHRANGGYLILPMKELLLNYFSWDSLKRALNNAELVIEDAGERYGFLTTKTLKPDPIPLNVQVILIGSSWLYLLLHWWDEDFRELFKVKAEFDTVMDFSKESILEFAMVTRKILKENDLLPIGKDAMCRLAEEASRLAGDRKKISIKFRDIRDILNEANHYALLAEESMIGAHQIDKAVESKFYRSNLIQEKINEMIQRNQLIIEFKGTRVGQINGISLIELGDISFGRPIRITATIGTGKEGILDIEREAKLAGPIHTKGVLILNGYLLDKYGQDSPISIAGNLVFEQSYSEIEGDSASSAELYTLISSLTQIPLKQSIAVTGSVNQKGEVQPVGGINEKIEGFFEVCKLKGLDGNQGVLIPAANKENLILKNEVVEAVKEGLFHIWAVRTIDEGLELLTGIPAGKMKASGEYTKDSIHFKVFQRIDQLNLTLKKYSNSQ